MEIFGRHIFGSDAQEFIDLCFEEQLAYIHKYTTQRDETQIKLLIDNLAVGKIDECLDCKKQRESYGSNIGERVVTEVAISSDQGSIRGNDERDNTERPKVKGTKNKRVHKG